MRTAFQPLQVAQRVRRRLETPLAGMMAPRSVSAVGPSAEGNGNASPNHMHAHGRLYAAGSASRISGCDRTGCSSVTRTQRRWLARGRGPRRGAGRKVERTVVHRETAQQRESITSASQVRRDHPWREEALWQILGRRTRSLSLWLDSVQDPHNLGACLRTADGAGCCAVVIPSRGAVGLTETVRDVACGAALAVPLIQVGSMAAAMKRFHDEYGLHFVGTSDKAGHTLFDAKLATHDHTALVLGSEGDGLRQQTTASCQELVKIPMLGSSPTGSSVPCLNVSVAAGVTLYEAVRQRQASNAARGQHGGDNHEKWHPEGGS